MKILFIGGTGIITTDTARLAVECGMDVTLLNRGTSKLAPNGAKQLHADIYDRDAVERAIGNETWDVILDCISYTRDELRYKLEVFRCRYRQFVFISSVAVYKNGGPLPRKENDPTGNFCWDYGYNKAACEGELEREHYLYGSEYTIVRPGETYNDLRIPMVIVANAYNGGYTMVDRIRRGKPLIVQDDGLTVSPFTHASDIAKGIVGLFMNRKAFGEAFHITTDEVHSWREVTQMVGKAAGRETRIVYVPTKELVKAYPYTPHGDTYGVLVGGKCFNNVFDNSKIKSVVPDFYCKVSLSEGLQRTIAFYDNHPEYKVTNRKLDEDMDRLVEQFDH